MRSIQRTLALAGMGMLLMPQVAAATDVEAEIRQVQERLDAIETQLEVTNEDLADANATVAAQQATIEAAGLEEWSGASALSAFIESTDITGWVATSYNYNFNGTGATNQAAGGGNCGGSNDMPGSGGGQLAGYCNPNTFQLDQAWFSIDKAPTSESRAGFHMDLVSGQATQTGGGSYAFNVETAYVSYLAPVLEGLQFDVGKQWTMIGAEVLATNANFQITRGIVWGQQPVTSTGLVAHLGITEGLSVSAGVINEVISDPTFDGNVGKALTSQVAYSLEKYSAAVSINYGREGSGPFERLLVVNALITADPLDNLSAWIDYVFRKNEFTGAGSVNTNAIAVAARLGILDETGVSMRFEYVDNVSGVSGANGLTVTGTVDQSLTDNLDLRAEVRWDKTSPDVLRNSSGNTLGDSQVVGLLQMIYAF